MGKASAIFYFYIRREDLLVLAEGLLRSLNNQFHQTKSVEIHVPGRRFEKLKGSVDNDLFMKDGLPEELPGEKLVLGTDFTALEKPDDFLTIPRDLSLVTEHLRTALCEVNRTWQSTHEMHASVYWTFWGLCKLRNNVGTDSKEEYFLRQSLYGGKIREPVLRITSDLVQNPSPEFIFRLDISSFVWSRYTSDFDSATQEWVAKSSSLQAESENARMLAKAVCDFIRQYPEAEIEWEMEQDHTPDLRGFLPAEFEARLGPPGNPKRVKDLAIK